MIAAGSPKEQPMITTTGAISQLDGTLRGVLDINGVKVEIRRDLMIDRDGDTWSVTALHPEVWCA
jgi:hypothetical protein